MIKQNGIPTTYNSDNVIMFMNKREMAQAFKEGNVDNPSISSWYKEDPNKRHRGMMTLWGDQAVKNSNTNILRDLIKDKSILEVNGWTGSFTYDRPIRDFKGCYTTKDTSNQLNPGIDGSTFKIVLNRRYSEGDHLTYDKLYGQQLIVSQETPVIQVAEGFEHTVMLKDNDKKSWFDPSYLTKGISYYKIGHSIFGERGTNFSKIDMPEPVGVMKCEFRLGAFSGVDTYMTGMASERSLSGGDAQSKQYQELLQREFDGKEYAVMYDLVTNKAGQKVPDFKTAKLGATLEFLTMRELEKITSERLMWSKAATVRNTNGEIVRINEGLWHQFRRGVIKTYAKPGGITQNLIAEIGEYIFRQNPNKPIVDRVLKLKCGHYAFQNIIDLFSKQIAEYNANLAPFLGSDRLIPNPVSGQDKSNLKYDVVRFTKCFIPNVGMLDIEEDTSLNFIDGVDRLSRGMHSHGFAHTAYSMVIWDVDSQEYSNNKELPKGTTLIEDGNKGANIHLVKPEGEMVFWGSTNGRYDYRRNGDIQSAGKNIGQDFWAFQVCDVHVDDLSKVVMIELDQNARRGFN